MQYVYAFKQCKRANYHVVLSFIEDAYKPDLNAPEPPDIPLLAHQRELAVRHFDALFSGAKIEEDFPDAIREVVQEALVTYETLCKKDQNFLSRPENLKRLV